MDVDQKPIPVQRDLDANFVDDDELQAALARTRRSKIKTKKLSPEEVAKKGRPFCIYIYLSPALILILDLHIVQWQRKGRAQKKMPRTQ